MLLAVLINTDAFEVQVPARSEVRLVDARNKQWSLHAEFLDTALDDVELERDSPSHLDGAAEGDFAVAFGEVQVADGETGTFVVDGEVDFGAAGEVFDVNVTAVIARLERKRISLNVALLKL